MLSSEHYHVASQVDQVLELGLLLTPHRCILHHQVQVLIKCHQFALDAEPIPQSHRDLFPEVFDHEFQWCLVAIHTLLYIDLELDYPQAHTQSVDQLIMIHLRQFHQPSLPLFT